MKKFYFLVSFLLIFLFAGIASAEPTFISGTDNPLVNNTDVVSLDVTQGNTILVWMCQWGGDPNLGVTDSQGNIFHPCSPVQSQYMSLVRGQWLWAVAKSTGTDIFTMTHGQYYSTIRVLQFSGLSKTNPVDWVGSGDTSTAAITTNYTDDLIVVGWEDGGNYNMPSEFTVIPEKSYVGSAPLRPVAYYIPGQILNGVTYSFVDTPANFEVALKSEYSTMNPPTTDFSGTPISGDYPLTVSFTDLSSESPTVWNWNFGDGSANSTLQNTSHQYSTVGNYTVTLTAGNAKGNNTIAKTEYIIVTDPSAPHPPVADFSADRTSGTAPCAIQFTDTSTRSPTSWYWSFGDGTYSTSQNPIHTYSDAGNYSVGLRATNADGSDNENKTSYITVSPNPVTPSFIYQFSDDNLRLNFTDTSTGSPTTWLWDFGDGYVSTEKNPMHTYATMGNYNVSLIANGNTITNQTVRVFDSSYIIIETTGSTFQPIITVNTTKYPSATVQWYYQDGTTSNLAAPSLKNFGSSGIRSTALKVTPWDAVDIMDFGYNMGDGGALGIVPLLDPQYVSKIFFLNNVKSSLRIFACENNNTVTPQSTIQSLNFDDFTKLEEVECYDLTTNKHVSLKNIPNVTRLCFEENGLGEINYTDCPNIVDIRGAAQHGVSKTDYIFGAPLYQNLRHLCIRGSGATNNIPWNKFPRLQQMWTWDDVGILGILNPSSTMLDGQDVVGCSFTTAYLYGSLSNVSHPGQFGMALNKLTFVNIFGNPACIGGSFLQNYLNQTEIDNILYACDLAGTLNGGLNIVKNYYPSSTGKKYIENLTAKGWTLVYDDSLNNTSIVQANYSKTAGTTGTNTTSLTLKNVKAGHLVAAFISSWDNGGCTPESVTDDQGHTYIAASDRLTPNSGYMYGRWFYYVATSSGDITGITGHFDKGQEPLISAVEIRGINNSNPIIFNNTAFGSTTNSITTTEPQLDLIAMYGTTSGYFRQNGIWHTDYFPIQSNNYCPIFYKGCSHNQTWQCGAYEGFSANYVLGLRVNDTREIQTEPPVASFTSYSKDAKHYITAFSDTSTNDPNYWQWNFGDGSANSTLQNPTHFYSDAGIYTVTLTAGNEAGNNTYSVATTKRDPELYWYQPYDINCGAPLTETQLSANASVPGTYTYNNSVGTVLNGGLHTLHVDFSPTDLLNYTSASKDVTLNVIKGTPEIAWSNPAEIIYGTPLSSTQLNADAGIPGTYTYTPASGTILGLGTHNLHVDFSPTDSTNYSSASKDVTINVVKTTPTITWNPANITYGTTLSSSLNANTGVAGNYIYNQSAGTVLGVGTYTLHVDFTPTDLLNYTSASKDVTLNVTKGTPEIAWSNPASILSGTALSGTQLNAGANVAGSFVYDPTSGTVLSLGTHQALTTTFTPTDSTNYTTATATVYIDVTSVTIPSADFSGSPTSGDIPLTVSFTDSSSGSPTSWAWSWGDATANSTTQNPTHEYSAAGTYTVSLTATNANGSDTETKIGYITVSEPSSSDPPVAAFSSNVTNGTEPLTVSFTDSSTNTPTSWLWNFGDGYTAVTQNPTHTYLDSGTYTVSLRATNAYGSDYENKTAYITVADALIVPVAAFSGTPRTGTNYANVTFTDSSTGSPTSWAWSFGDGTSNSTSQNPVHNFTSIGTYTVTLTATNANGSDSEIKTGYITVSGPGTISLSDYSGSNFTVYPTRLYVGQHDIVTLTDRVYYNSAAFNLSGITIYYVYTNDLQTVSQNITCTGSTTGKISIPMNYTNSGTAGTYFGQYILTDGETRLTIPASGYVVMKVNSAI